MALTDAEILDVRERHGLNQDSDADTYIPTFKVYRYRDGTAYVKANMASTYLVDTFDPKTMGIFTSRSPLEIVTFGITSLKDENSVWVEWTGGEG